MKFLRLRNLIKRFGCPAPHGAGGLKSLTSGVDCGSLSPAPHGAGGLKLYADDLNDEQIRVPPRTGRVD